MPEKKKRKHPLGTPIRRDPPMSAGPEDDDEDEEEIEEISEEEIEDGERLKQFQDQFGGQQYRVRIDRVNPESGDLEIVDRVFLDNFDPYLIGKRFGGGQFICTLLNENGKYVKGGRMHFRFAVQEPEKDERSKSLLQDPTVMFIIEQQKQQTQMIADMMKTALSQEKQTDIDKIIAAISSLNGLMPKEKEVNSMKQLGELLEIQAKIQALSGKEDGGGSVMSEIKEIANVLMNMKGQAVRAPAGSPPKMTINAPGAPIVLRKSDPLKEEAMSPAIQKILFYVPKLKEAGETNASVEKWASFVLNVLDMEVVPALVAEYNGLVTDDRIWELLIDAAQKPEEREKIFRFAPDLEICRDWVNRVIDQALKDTLEDAPSDENSIAENGHLALD